LKLEWLDGGEYAENARRLLFLYDAGSGVWIKNVLQANTIEIEA
jgi:hypothetical protein